MKYPSLHLLKISLTLAAVALCLSVQAFAACPEPASGSVAICQPSANSTIYQVPHIEALANPSSGSITAMKVYIDDKLVFQSGGPEISLFEGGVANGTHHLVVHAWDGLAVCTRRRKISASPAIFLLPARSQPRGSGFARPRKVRWFHRISGFPLDSRAMRLYSTSAR